MYSGNNVIFNWVFQKKNSVIEMVKMAGGWMGSCQMGTLIVRIGSCYFTDQ